MPSTLITPLHELSLSELNDLFTFLVAQIEEMRTSGQAQVQTEHFWMLQADSVRVFEEIGWRKKRLQRVGD